MTIATPMTVPNTLPASGSDREARLRDQTDQLSEAARRRIAALSSGASECREVALMLGLVEVDPDGSLQTANPWAAEIGEGLPNSPKG